MTTLNSWFEPSTYKNAVAGCIGHVFMIGMIMIAVLAFATILLPLINSGKPGQSICPHCGKSLKIEKAE
jgi:hypothetical protein